MRNLKNLLIAFLLAAVSPAPAAGLDTQKNSDRGVTLAVTPQNLSGDARTWDFKIVLDTHSADLNDDLVKSAVLIDGSGGKHAPVAWDGAGPGGHHREGVLRFMPLPSRQQTIELQIARPGEPKARSFRWQVD
jgi:hypothetical protein